MRLTPTRTLGMRLSCNFVNVYTIVYHVQYIYTCVHARIPNGHPREEMCASDKCPPTSHPCVSGSWRAERAARASRPAACASAGRLPQRVPQQLACRANFRMRRTRRLPREDPPAEVGEEVRVGVGVRVNPVEFKLNTMKPDIGDIMSQAWFYIVINVLA